MPHLPQRGGSNGACPDAATVLAVIEGEADDWLRDAYAQHLSRCSACLDLDSRLRNFDRPVLADEAEWRQTEKRLDNWMGAFLDARPAAASPELPNSQATPVGFWHSLWRPGLAWKLSLATALLALVAVGVDVYLRLQIPVQPDQAKVTTSAPHAEETKTVAPPAANVTPNEVPKTTPTASPLPGGGMPRNGGPMAAVPTPAPLVKPKAEEAATVAKAVAPSEPQQQGALETPSKPQREQTQPEFLRAEQTMGGEPATQSGEPEMQSASVLTNTDIVKMAKVRLGDDIIIASIQSKTRNFDTSVDALVKLKEAGVSDAVLQAMQDSQEIAMAAGLAPAPLTEETVSFFVRHPHPRPFALSKVESYSSGTLSISPDGTVAYDCTQTDDPSGRCEHVVFAPGSLKAIKVGPGGKLHLASRTQGNFDLYGNPEDMKQVQAAIAPLIDPTLRNRFPREHQTHASAASPSAGVDTSASQHSSVPTLPARPAVSTSAGETQPSKTAKASAPAMPRAAIPNQPSSLHLASGARLWITLDSVVRQPNGAFQFVGSLLMALDASGSSHLDRGTGLSGSGTEAQGRTSLVISEILIAGSHYKLKSQAGAGNARTAGSGGAVQFDSGKVLEMWVSSDSIYERSPADSTQ